MKQKYEVFAIMNGSTINVRKHFLSRNGAIDYMVNYYQHNLLDGFQIEEEVAHSKHNIEYIGDHSNRFIIDRVHA